jgi:hypothetical protein
MNAQDTSTPGGRPVRIAAGPLSLIGFAVGLGLTAWPSGQVGVAILGLLLLWLAAMTAAWRSGPMIRFGGTFFIACAIWAALGFGFPGSFSRWPAADAAISDAGLPATTLTDDRYKDLVALNASVRSNGTQFVVTNLSTQPWEHVTLAIIGAGSEEYDLQIEGISPGQSANAQAVRFVTSKGSRYNPQRARARTFIVTADIGAGGPAGVYAVRL